MFVVMGAVFLYRGLTGNTPASGPASLKDPQPAAPSQLQRRMYIGLGIAFILFAVIDAATYLLHAHS